MSIRIHFLAAAFIVFIPVNAHSATLTVGEGAEFNFSTISSAVESATNGDSILILPGIYNMDGGETFPILIDKSLSLIGSSSAEVIVDATGSDASVFVINQTFGFLVSGLTITGGSSELGGSGIRAFGGSGTIGGTTFRGNTTTSSGGGVELTSTQNITFEDCLFEDNHAPGRIRIRPDGGSVSNGDGGGISFSGFSTGTLVIRRCRFIGNSASTEGAALRVQGQGIQVIVEDCEFERNRNSAPELIGPSFAAAYFRSGPIATFRRCRFRENEKTFTRGDVATFAYRNFSLYQESVIGEGSLLVEDCEFTGNRGMGGVRLGRGRIVRSIIRGNEAVGCEALDSEVEECTILENGLTGLVLRTNERVSRLRDSQVLYNGFAGTFSNRRNHIGGVHLVGDDFEIIDATIIGNKGRGQVGGLDAFFDNLVMTNTIVAGNEGTGDYNTFGAFVLRGGVRDGNLEIRNCTFAANVASTSPEFASTKFDGIQVYPPASVNIINSIIWNGIQALSLPDESSVTHCNLSQFRAGEGNIFTDPQFLHPWDGEFADLRLPCDSPAVDAGTLEGAPTRDIEGVTRPRGAGVDMGAYENCHFDLNGDRSEDRRDVVSFTAEWHRPIDETNFGFDLDRLPPSTGRIDRLDLDALLEGIKPNP